MRNTIHSLNCNLSEIGFESYILIKVSIFKLKCCNLINNFVY